MIAGMNHRWAKSTYGKFILQVDDVLYNRGRYWRFGWPIEKAVAAHEEMLEWMGYPPDETFYSATNEKEQRECCKAIGIPWPADGEIADEIPGCNLALGPGLDMGMSGSEGQVFTKTWFNAIRVADDYTCGIGAFFRGFDLVGEFGLYIDAWRRAYDNPVPSQHYKPILGRVGIGPESSTGGSVSVLDLRDVGYTPHQIKTSLLAIQQHAEKAQLNAYLIPEGYLEASEVGPVPHVCDDDANGIRGQGGHSEEQANADIAVACEKHVREDLAEQGFAPGPVITAIKRGEDVYEWALANKVKPEE